MWKTSSIVFFGGITIFLLLSSFFYFKGKLNKLQTQNLSVVDYYDSKFDSLVLARTDSVRRLFADSIKSRQVALEQTYLDSVSRFNNEIDNFKRSLRIHELIPEEVRKRQERKSKIKVIERKLRLKSYEGIYEEPTSKVLFFGQNTIPYDTCTVKLTFPGNREFEETWVVGKVYYYKFDDTDFYMEVFVEAISEDYFDIILQIY